MTHLRYDKRQPDQLRPLQFQMNFQRHAAGSVLVEAGQTRVICSVTVTPGVPPWMRAQNVSGGWLTCEYRMLPGATAQRSRRESGNGPGGRTHEIQRLIGRSLRAVVDLQALGCNTVNIDCDVLDADGGTRCAAITGACVALDLALRKMLTDGTITSWPLRQHVAAVSVGVVDAQVMLDLCYEEDAAASVDMNVVMTGNGEFVEVQGTGEGATFTESQMQQMLQLARRGLDDIFQLQKQVLQ